MRFVLLFLLLLPTLAISRELPRDAFSPASFPEARLVYLDFWASWCVPCRKSFPWLNEMQKKYGERGLKVIGISVDRSPEDARKFLEKYPADFDIVIDSTGQLASLYQLEGMPSAVMVRPDGTELGRHIGFRENEMVSYEKHLGDALMGESE